MNNTILSTNLIEVSFSGKDVNPNTVKIGDIADLLKSIETVVESKVFRDHPEIDKDKVILGFVNIKSNSIDLQFASPIPEITISAFLDIGQAINTNDYSKLPSGSIKSLNAIVSFTHKKHCIAEFVHYNGHRNVLATITQQTIIEQIPLLKGETTIYGQIVRVGGKTPKVMFETVDGQIIFCDAEKSVATKLGGYLYQIVGLIGIAEWESDTLKIKEFNIKEIIFYENKQFSEAIKQLSEITNSYYADITDVEQYIENIRGFGEGSAK